MGKIRISGIQMVVSPRLADNLEKILHLIGQGGCDFLLFPEMSLTGRHVDFGQRAVTAAWRQIAEACRQAYVTAIVGTTAQLDGHAYIQSRIYSDSGDLVGTHEKLVPTKSDRQFCQPGEELRAFNHRNLTFGCLIGNDLWVTPGYGPYPDPRLTYQLAQQGVQVVFHSANSGIKALETAYHESNLVLRAVESGLYIVTANAADLNDPVNAPTGVVSPDGQWVARVPPKGEHRFTCDIDIETD